MPNKDISKLIGDKWKQMTDAEKQPYLDKATSIREKFNKEHPDFKYSNCPKALRTYLKLNARQISALFQQQAQQQQQQPGHSGVDSHATGEDSVPAKKRKVENPHDDQASGSENEYGAGQPEEIVMRLVIELVNQKKLSFEDYNVLRLLALRRDPRILAIYNECVLSSKECTIDYFCARIHGLAFAAQRPQQLQSQSQPQQQLQQQMPTNSALLPQHPTLTTSGPCVSAFPTM